MATTIQKVYRLSQAEYDALILDGTSITVNIGGVPTVIPYDATALYLTEETEFTDALDTELATRDKVLSDNNFTDTQKTHLDKLSAWSALLSSQTSGTSSSFNISALADCHDVMFICTATRTGVLTEKHSVCFKITDIAEDINLVLNGITNSIAFTHTFEYVIDTTTATFTATLASVTDVTFMYDVYIR